jgi:predicted amidohydrolase
LVDPLFWGTKRGVSANGDQFDINPQLVAEMARKNADVVVGIKSAHFAGRGGKLRPGDTSTHFYRWSAPLLDKDGKVSGRARKRVVKFDVGHGGATEIRRPELVRSDWARRPIWRCMANSDTQT